MLTLQAASLSERSRRDASDASSSSDESDSDSSSDSSDSDSNGGDRSSDGSDSSRSDGSDSDADVTTASSDESDVTTATSDVSVTTVASDESVTTAPMDDCSLLSDYIEFDLSNVPEFTLGTISFDAPSSVYVLVVNDTAPTFFELLESTPSLFSNLSQAIDDAVDRNTRLSGRCVVLLPTQVGA